MRNINRLDEDKTENREENRHNTDDMIKWVNDYVKQLKIRTVRDNLGGKKSKQAMLIARDS